MDVRVRQAHFLVIKVHEPLGLGDVDGVFAGAHVVL